MTDQEKLILHATANQLYDDSARKMIEGNVLLEKANTLFEEAAKDVEHGNEIMAKLYNLPPRKIKPNLRLVNDQDQSQGTD